jgi:NADH-quinone oxidoreductase subunit F
LPLGDSVKEADLISLKTILEEHAGRGKSSLLPVLQATQNQRGYISEATAAEISHALGVPLADVYGVIEFYSLLTTHPPGRTRLQVCSDPVCALQGADELLDHLCQRAGIEPGQVSADGRFEIERVPCLGLCNHAPAVLIDREPVGSASSGTLDEILRGDGKWQEDWVGGSAQVLTANCRGPGPMNLQKYRARNGYEGLRRALRLSQEEVISEVKAAGLLGRGGAAFPAGIKWEAVFNASGDTKYVVCNADESEPGAFKDRILLEKDPHRVLEGLIISAYAVGAQQGYIYVRGEYPKAFAALKGAIAEARQAGNLGVSVLGSDFSFEIELRQGAGAYICGEETALFESIEGKRGFPRIKPPFPTTHGLFGKPTVINNVETLCNVPFVLREGAEFFRKFGTALSTGTKLFCVSGDVVRPGLYEVPFGVTLRSLLYSHAGGVPAGKGLGAVLLGGAAGTFALEEDLDVRLSFEHLRSAGLVLGSGSIMVFDDTRDMRDVLRRVARFFAEESCGKCFPCQIGTQRQYEILTRAAAGQAVDGDEARLIDVGWTMADASLCGLGQTAASAVLSAIKRWPELFAGPSGQ